MALPEPKVATFDVVGALIDFEAGMLGYLRDACGPALAATDDDDAILASYRAARACKSAERFPDDLVRVYGERFKLGLPQDDAIGAARWPRRTPRPTTTSPRWPRWRTPGMLAGSEC